MTAGITTILDGITLALAFIWGLFSQFLTTIATEPLFFYPVALSILTGCIFLAIKIVRKFGVKGKR